MVADREFRRWQEDLRQARRQWEGSDREDEALLRGRRLLDAKFWCENRQNELSSGDCTFIHRSLSLQERDVKQRRRRRQVVISSLIAGLLAALTLAGVAWWGWQAAAIREAKAISTSANALFVSDQRLDALVESLRAWQKLQKLAWADTNTQAQVETVVRQATYGANEQNRLSGHQDFVYGVAFSPDGQLIATASLDGTAILWNRDGTKLRTLRGHHSVVHAAVFSPDSQLIATASKDDQIKIWQRNGSLVKLLRARVMESTMLPSALMVNKLPQQVEMGQLNFGN